MHVHLPFCASFFSSEKWVDNSACPVEMLLSLSLLRDRVSSIPIISLNPTSNAEGGNDSHFIDENTEAYRENIICLGSSNGEAWIQIQVCLILMPICLSCSVTLGNLTSHLQASVPHL